MALAERMLAAGHGSDVVDHYTYVIAGDGCLMEGISHEAISLAGHSKLGKLIVFWDDNSISIDGATNLSVSDDQLKRFEASNWNTTAINRHDPAQISAAIKKAKADPSKPWMSPPAPSLVMAHPRSRARRIRTKARLARKKSTAPARRSAGQRRRSNPADILDAWRAIGAKGHKLGAKWRAKAATYKR